MNTLKIPLTVYLKYYLSEQITILFIFCFKIIYFINTIKIPLTVYLYSDKHLLARSKPVSTAQF